MSLNGIVTDFIKSSNQFIINYDTKKLSIVTHNPTIVTTDKYETDFKPIKHEGFTKFKCGPENNGYCHIDRACNDEGACGSMQTHYKPDGKNVKYRSCGGPLDKDCVERVYCDQNYNCTPLYRTNLNDSDRVTLDFMKKQ